jgi:transcriptional regulator with XRE-family HTH domain
MPRLSTLQVPRERIFEAREAAGLTQEALARRMNCSLPTIQKYEGGQRNPSRQMLTRLAEATGQPLSFFLDNDKAAA